MAAPDTALCIVGPDISGCIDFYFLHKKGFGFDEKAPLFRSLPSGQPYVADCIRRGARYLYTDDSTLVDDPRLQPYLDRPVKKVGTFHVLALRPAAH